MIVVPMTVTTGNVAVPVSTSASEAEIAMSVALSYRNIEGDPYTGPYEFTPSAETQVAQTLDKVLFENIVINPIPQNYGLITYNGNIITVS